MEDKHDALKMGFNQELIKLKQHKLISEEDYIKVNNAHKRYYEELELIKSSSQMIENKVKNYKSKNTVMLKPKKILSPQDIRERNISWILIIGVVLVLMSGIVLATSSWNMMNNALKTILISLVAGLFFAISVVSGKLLKIEKTSFAFWFLGSLFLPVAVLSAGYFKLFGEYLSIYGMGKYLLGALGASVCLPVYLYSAKRYNNRLFVWISLITLSCNVAFILASLHLKKDLFYLGIVLYNGIVLYIHNRIKNNDKIKLLTTEIPVFAQVNLILSTLFVVSFYTNGVFYGFNILLTATLYILMVFAKGHKEYSYVFSVLFVYGIYQITESSFLSNVDLLIFSMIGVVFVTLERSLKKEYIMQKIFNYTNAIISALAFIYISYQGILIRVNQSSWMLFFAYIAIALNYLYLSNRTFEILFAYLTPIFFISAAYQGYTLIQSHIPVDVKSGILFAVGTLMFVTLYFKNKFKYLQTIKLSGLLAALLIMIYSIFSGLAKEQLILVSIEFIIFGVAFYIMYKIEIETDVKQFCKYALPSTWFISAFIICLKIGSIIRGSTNLFKASYEFLVAVLIIFAIGYLCERYDVTLKKPFHYVAHILMPLATLTIITEHYHEPYAFILITIIYVYSALISHTEWRKKAFLYASFTIGVITLYILIDSLTELVKLTHQYTLTEYILAIGVIFIGVIWYFINNEWRERTAYYLVPFNIIALISLMFINPFGYVEFILMVICMSFDIYLMKHYKIQILQIVPLLIFFVGLNMFMDFKFKHNITATLVCMTIFTFVLKVTGELLFHRLYGRNDEKKAIPVYFDWFVFTALMLTVQIEYTTSIYVNSSKYGDMIAPILVVYIVYSQIKRVPKGFSASIAKTITGLSLLIPYYTIMGKIYHAFYISTIYQLIETELYLFPWIILVMIMSKKVWYGYENITNKVEMCVVIIVAFILCKDLSGINQLSEGLILGVLSLASIIGGMQFKKKSFFFVGSGALIFNMFVQTRDFWGNLPWWVYLLVAGMILIGTASIHEINKNKKTIKIDKQALFYKFKNWN